MSAVRSEFTPGLSEPIDSVIRRFKKACDKNHVLQDFKKHQFFITRAEKRRVKSAAARRAVAKITNSYL